MNKIHQLQEAFNQFNHNSEFLSYSELASGHINDTYLVKTADGTSYVLQRINNGVFKDVPGLISNKVNVSKHLQKKLAHLPKNEIFR
ncbi:MAG: aminoglycoside phosphotransferase family protein, partial [Lutibacter sp.]